MHPVWVSLVNRDRVSPSAYDTDGLGAKNVDCRR